MWLANLFKKNNRKTTETGNYISFEEKLLEQCIEFIPAHFRKDADYAAAVAYLSHGQFDLAVRKLVQLADKPGFFFNNDYWLELKQVAGKLGMEEESRKCDEKLEDNTEHNIVLYKGIVIEKVSEDTYRHYVSDSLTNEANAERREKDGLKEMMAVNGFYRRSYGREGMIYHINGKRVCEIRYQHTRTADHLVVYAYSYEYLALPIRQRLSEQEKETLRNELMKWLNSQNITAEYL